MRYGLSKKHIAIIRSVFLAHPFIEEALLFGSRAIGSYKETSDIDIALKGTMTEAMVSKVKGALNEETSIPLFFDIVNYYDIQNQHLLEEINEKGVSIYHRPPLAPHLRGGAT